MLVVGERDELVKVPSVPKLNHLDLGYCGRRVVLRPSSKIG